MFTIISPRHFNTRYSNFQTEKKNQISALSGTQQRKTFLRFFFRQPNLIQKPCSNNFFKHYLWQRKKSFQKMRKQNFEVIVTLCMVFTLILFCSEADFYDFPKVFLSHCELKRLESLSSTTRE